MNEQNKFSKLFFLIAFIALAIVSCWATAESLHLLLPSWPIFMCWVVTIAFFIIASIGTKWIVDSLNQNIYLEKRGLHLVGGIIIVLIFWLICSMPTNTHTFFYRNNINGVVSSDIATTQGYLDQLKNGTITEAKIRAKCNEIENNVNVKLGELEAEIKNEANPGFGPKSKEILRDFANLLDVVKVEPLSYRSISVQERQILVDAYRQKIYTLLKTKKENIRLSMMSTDENLYKTQAATDNENLKIIESGIKDKTIDLNNAEDITEVNDRLNKAYSTIKTYNQYINFQSQEDKDLYLAQNPVTKVKGLISVFDVWKGFLAGKYAGHGFLFWVVISILVDIAAFIFFALVFKKRE